MTPEEWYVVDMEREYFLQPHGSSYSICGSNTPILHGWGSRDDPNVIPLSGERVVSRDDLLAIIGMMHAKKAMEDT